MGFIKPSPQPIEPAEFVRLPLRDRLQVLTRAWVDDGFGMPHALHVVYVLKMLGLYLAGGVLIASLTSDIAFTHIGSWWDDVFVYEKLAVWLMLLEVIGLGGAWGPLCGHFKPMTGNIRYWIRPGTIRIAPWGGKVPFTDGDTRSIADVVLYVGVLAALVVPLAAPAHSVPGFADQHTIAGWTFVPVLVLMPLMGLRDKAIFLAARSEQYLPIMLYSAVFAGHVVDLVIAFKIVIVCVWLGAGTSKFGHHFVNVIPPMVSNSPAMPGRWSKRLHYRRAPDDLLPSRFAWFMAHVGGTTVEIITPLVLLLTTNATVALVGACLMALFHVFITSTFPLAVPLEWNVFFAFAAVSLWAGHDPSRFSVYDFSQPWLLIPMFALALFFPALGNLRPDLVSFLPSMRQYAGNWASAVWAMKPGIEKRLNELPGSTIQLDQVIAMNYEPDDAEMSVQKTIAWRAMHSQGRGLFSLLYEHLDDIESRTVREAEMICNSIIGWNFGDGHLHDDRLVAAVQRRLHLSPGDLVVAYVESQPIHKPTQEYRVIDAALGVVERGTWKVANCIREQPWLPNGPVPLEVTWTAPGYRRRQTLTTAEEQPA